MGKGLTVLLDDCRVPVVLAPGWWAVDAGAMRGGQRQGGQGFLAAGYLSAAELAARVERTCRLTGRSFGVNLFVPAAPGDPAAAAAYAARLEQEARRVGVRLGEPAADDDDWSAKLDLLTAAPVPVVSFTFGCPAPEVVAGLHRAGSEVWAAGTNVEEARLAQHVGAHGLVVQGGEAGGHRGGFTDTEEAVGALALLQLVRPLRPGPERTPWAPRSCAAPRRAPRRCTGRRCSSSRPCRPARSPAGSPAACATASPTGEASPAVATYWHGIARSGQTQSRREHR